LEGEDGFDYWQSALLCVEDRSFIGKREENICEQKCGGDDGKTEYLCVILVQVFDGAFGRGWILGIHHSNVIVQLFVLSADAKLHSEAYND
jgi:hypothetical protein